VWRSMPPPSAWIPRRATGGHISYRASGWPIVFWERRHQSPDWNRWVEAVQQPIDRYARWLGFLGEAEVVRRLAENPSLDIFRPFPDLEMVEVLARSRITRRYCGLQVKTGVPAEARGGEARIAIRKATLVPASTTYIAALAWMADERQFADEFLLIPTNDLAGIAVDDGVHLFLNFHPRSQERTRLDPYRQLLSDLGQLAEDACAL